MSTDSKPKKLRTMTVRLRVQKSDKYNCYYVYPDGDGMFDTTTGDLVVATLTEVLKPAGFCSWERRYTVDVGGVCIGYVESRAATFERKPRGSRIVTSRWESMRWFRSTCSWDDQTTAKKQVVSLYEDWLNGRTR